MRLCEPRRASQFTSVAKVPNTGEGDSFRVRGFSVFIYLCFVTSHIFSHIFFCVSLLMFCDAFFAIVYPIFYYIFPLFTLFLCFLPICYPFCCILPIFTVFYPFFTIFFPLFYPFSLYFTHFLLYFTPFFHYVFYPKDLSFFYRIFPLKIRILYPRKASKQGGAVEACWAHNPEVGGSKPLSAKVFCRIFSLKDRTKGTVNPAFSLLIFCDFMVSYKVTVICVSVLLARWM